MRRIHATQNRLATKPIHPALDLPSAERSSDTVFVHMRGLGITRDSSDEWRDAEVFSVDRIASSLIEYAVENNIQYEASTRPAVVVLDIEGDYHPLRSTANIRPCARAADACRQVWGAGVKVLLWMPSPKGKSWESLHQQYRDVTGWLSISANFDGVAHSVYVPDESRGSEGLLGWEDLDARLEDARNILKLWEGILPVYPVLSHRINGTPVRHGQEPNEGRVLDVQPGCESLVALLGEFEAWELGQADAGGVKGPELTILWWDAAHIAADRSVIGDPEGLQLTLEVLYWQEEQEPLENRVAALEIRQGRLIDFDHALEERVTALERDGNNWTRALARLQAKSGDHEARLRALERPGRLRRGVQTVRGWFGQGSSE